MSLLDQWFKKCSAPWIELFAGENGWLLLAGGRTVAVKVAVGATSEIEDLTDMGRELVVMAPATIRLRDGCTIERVPTNSTLETETDRWTVKRVVGQTAAATHVELVWIGSIERGRRTLRRSTAG